jgi:hypothetical protein
MLRVLYLATDPDDSFTPRPLSNLMSTKPTYVSNCTKRNLWQKYEIYDDRIELHTWLGVFKIPLDQIDKVDVYPPVLKSLRLHLRKCLPMAIKLDTTDFSEHLVLDKKTGFVRHVLFTPEDPAEFKRVLDQARAAFDQEGPETQRANRPAGRSTAKS